MKLFSRVLIGAAFLLVLALVALFFAIDRVVGTAIERGGTYALGVDTDVGWVRLGWGSFRLGGLSIANPAGFEADHFLRLGGGGLDVDMGTLREATVVVPRIALDDVELHLEGKGRDSNVQAILRNLQRFESGKQEAPPPSEAEGGKQLLVSELVITDVVARVDVIGAGLRLLRQVEVEIPEIRLTNVGQGRPVSYAQLADIVVKAVLQAVLRSGTDLGLLAGDLRGGLQGLASVPLAVEGEITRRALEAAREGAAPEKVVEEAAKGAAEEAGKAVRGLLGRDGEK